MVLFISHTIWIFMLCRNVEILIIQPIPSHPHISYALTICFGCTETSTVSISCQSEKLDFGIPRFEITEQSNHHPDSLNTSIVVLEIKRLRPKNNQPMLRMHERRAHISQVRFGEEGGYDPNFCPMHRYPPRLLILPSSAGFLTMDSCLPKELR